MRPFEQFQNTVYFIVSSQSFYQTLTMGAAYFVRFLFIGAVGSSRARTFSLSFLIPDKGHDAKTFLNKRDTE